MDRSRQDYARQRSLSSPTHNGSPSPRAPVMHRHSRSGSSNMNRPQHTKAAAQRLARVMAHQQADDDEEDDLYEFDPVAPLSGVGLAGGRQRNRSPLSVRTSIEQPTSARSRTSVNSVEQQLPSNSASIPRIHRPNPPPPSSSISSRSSQNVNSTEEAEQPSVQFHSSGRSSSQVTPTEQPTSARSGAVSRPNLVVKTVQMVPPVVPLSIKPTTSGIPAETQPDKARDKRLSLDFGTFKYKEPSDQQSSSALQDELDMLQEENDGLLEKLRLAEERCEEAEARARQLEKQIASLGEGVSLEARLLSRKEADLQKREAALKIAAQTYGGGGDEIAALRTEAEAARDEATTALERLHDVEEEAKSLRTLTQRMILSQEEKIASCFRKRFFSRDAGLLDAGAYLSNTYDVDQTEKLDPVQLKSRLKRLKEEIFVSSCLKFITGIHAEICGARHEYWSSLDSDPVEVILAAGTKAREDNSWSNTDSEEREKVLQDQKEIFRRTTVESMLLVEQGLRELTSLKVGEAIAISLAQRRRPNIVKSDELKLPAEGQSFSEAFELSQDETEDVLLKRAWLAYFWRRAKNHGLEPDIAEERLQFWINQADKTPTSHDAVDVERGLIELRKLGIETKLWEETRRLIDRDSNQKTLLEAES